MNTRIRDAQVLVLQLRYVYYVVFYFHSNYFVILSAYVNWMQLKKTQTQTKIVWMFSFISGIDSYTQS